MAEEKIRLGSNYDPSLIGREAYVTEKNGRRRLSVVGEAITDDDVKILVWDPSLWPVGHPDLKVEWL